MRKLLFILNIILILLGYGVFFNQWVSPSVTTVFEYLALLFPLIIILDVLFIIFWLFRDWKKAVLVLILSIGLIIPLNRIYHLYGGEKSDKANLKFATYNVRSFTYDKKNQIKNLIVSEDPDVFILQEYSKGKSMAEVNENYPYKEVYGKIGIFSKYPIVESNQLKIGKRNIRACYADVKVKNDTLRVVNLHLSSTKVSKNQIKGVQNTKTLENSVKKVMRNLFSAFKQHQKQINEVKRVVEKSPYPVIVGGDFNAVPSSYEYYKIKKGLKDTFEAAGEGFGATFYDYKFPIKIDHVFCSPQIGVNAVDIKNVKYSDHYPVFVTFSYRFKNK